MVLGGFGAGSYEDSFEMKTIAANRIEGLLRMSSRKLDGEVSFRYDVTGLMTFASYCEAMHPGADALRRILADLMDSLERFGDYLIDTDHILLDPGYMYIERDSGKVSCAFVPAFSEPFCEQLLKLAEYMLMEADASDNECVIMLCRLLGELRRGEGTLADLKAALVSNNGGAAGYGIAADRAFTEAAVNEAPLPDRGGDETGLPRSRGGLTPEEEPGAAYSDREERWHFRDDKRAGERPDIKRRLLPENYTLTLSAFMAAAAAIVWTGLRFQRIFVMTAAEMAAGAAGGAAALLICAIIACRVLNAAEDDAEEIPAFAGGGPYPYSESGAGEERRGISPETFISERGEGDFGGDDPFFLAAPLPMRASSDLAGAAYEAGAPSGATILLDSFAPDAGRGFPALLPADSKGSEDPIFLSGNSVRVGHDPAMSDAVIKDRAVSRVHARIYFREGKYYVSDMGSKNGTAVNGEAVIDPSGIALSEGDRVRFGRSEFVFREGTERI